MIDWFQSSIFYLCLSECLLKINIIKDNTSKGSDDLLLLSVDIDIFHQEIKHKQNDQTGTQAYHR